MRRGSGEGEVEEEGAGGEYANVIERFSLCWVLVCLIVYELLDASSTHAHYFEGWSDIGAV